MEDHISALIQQIQSADVVTQQQSITELGQVDISAHRPDVIKVLCNVLQHKQLEVREAAKKALIQIKYLNYDWSLNDIASNQGG